MINHVRSVLLNAICPGEFSEPTDSAPISLPIDASTTAARRILVPDDFPNRTRNFMATMWQKMAAQHPLYSLIQSVDRRELITSQTSVSSLGGGLSVVHRGAVGGTFGGGMTATPQLGTFSGTWIVRKFDESSVSVCDTATMNTANLNIEFNSDCSNQVLFGGGITLRFVGVSSIPAINVQVSASTPFDFDLSAMLSKMRTTSGIVGIFDLKQDRGVVSTLLSDFLNGRRPDIALSAAVIACVLKMTERGMK